MNRVWHIALAGILVSGAATARPTSKSPFLVNGIAATVGKALITVQDAYFYRAVQRFREGDASPLRPEEGEELKKTVRKLIFEEMVEEEMKSLKFEEKSAAPEAEGMLRGNKTKPKQKQLAQILSHFGKTESAAVELLSRSLKVDKFMQRKVETLTPVVTQADVERYLKQNEARFKGNDMETLKPNIILLIKKEQTQKGLEEWLRFLRDKYGVTNYLDS